MVHKAAGVGEEPQWERTMNGDGLDWQELGPMDRFESNAISTAKIIGEFGNTIDLAVVRTSAGLDVIVDRCPHQGVALTERGCLNEHNQLVCTWHNWALNLPHGTDSEEPGVTLHGLESKIEGGSLWAKPEPGVL